MSGHSFANKDVMEDYMSALLTDDTIVKDAQRQSVEQLLNTAPTPRSEPFASPTQEFVAPTQKFVQPREEPVSVVAKVTQSQAEKRQALGKIPRQIIKPVIPTEPFQVLLFEVAGITLAVPLIELGGIHKIESVSPLFGKPAWFKGVFLHRDEKYNVVDTAKWVMLGKSAEKLAGLTKYQYLITLGESGWGLGCESLIATETLLPDEVKWRDVEVSRPWLSGMIKKKMCALLNVQQLISMLNQGLSSND